MKYRKKPVVIEAHFYDGDLPALMEWSRGVSAGNGTTLSYSEQELSIKTLEGTMKVSRGDWVICGVNGEFYPCKNDIFHKTYEVLGK